MSGIPNFGRGGVHGGVILQSARFLGVEADGLGYFPLLIAVSPIQKNQSHVHSFLSPVLRTHVHATRTLRLLRGEETCKGQQEAEKSLAMYPDWKSN